MLMADSTLEDSDMNESTITINNSTIPVVKTVVGVIGTGAASLNAAVQCSRAGISDIVIVTDRIGGGTSANTGSDKQTYYRCNPVSEKGDSTYKMARDLFNGGAMHGDIAHIEATCSLMSFFNLASLGVNFPYNRYGDHVGYKTDHDPLTRGTSAGPSTSIDMFNCLLNEVKRLKIPVFDNHEVVELCTSDDNNSCIGFIAVEKDEISDNNYGLRAFLCDYVVCGTGGPAALYADTVYPSQQAGSLGMALKMGVPARNLTESQFGIASTKYRWNLSGSYQQVLPCYISRNSDNNDEQEFLVPVFPDAGSMLTAQFLKGYQWPFDVRRIADFGSSVIDLLVYYETKVRGRRVFLDFRKNPTHAGYTFSVDSLPSLALEYLEKSNSLQETPVERLKAMNLPAYQLYLDNGIDLAGEPLEIAVCNQHLNGGLSANIWWESPVKGFFPVGECCGTHGIYRPGGSALNAGQVGGLRCAKYIRHDMIKNKKRDHNADVSAIAVSLKQILELLSSILTAEKRISPARERKAIKIRMSETMGIIRDPVKIEIAQKENHSILKDHDRSGVASRDEILSFLKNRDLLVTEKMFVHQAVGLLSQLRGGRGSWLLGNPGEIFITDNNGTCIGIAPVKTDFSRNDTIFESQYRKDGEIITSSEPVRPLPEPDAWFESVWHRYMDGTIFELEE